MAGHSGHARAPHQLPSGRHGLPRAFVISNQRERILDAVMQTVAEHGYVAMRIEDVIAVAGVSRRTFYDHFTNKEDAFLAAYDLIYDQLRAAIATAYGSADTWASGIRRGLAAFLNLLASEPVLAHLCIVDVLAAGPRALERRTAAMADFREYLTPGPDVAPPGVVTPLTAETVVGGVYEVIYSRVVQNRTHELPALVPELLYSVLLPFAGPEIARAEYQRALSRVPAGAASPS
jgi:AcrR family transcriptional regulator